MNKGYGRLSCSGSYSITYNLPYWFYKFINNKKYHMGDITVIAEKRLAMIEFYYQVKNATAVCNSFKTSRKTFYKWLNRYEKSGKKLFSLEDELKRLG